MTIYDKIKVDLLTFQKARKTQAVQQLRVIIGEFDRVGKQLSDDQAIKVLTRMKKAAKECKDFEDVVRYNMYLPTLFHRDDIKAKLQHIISVEGIKTFPASFGVIMGHFNRKFKGKADNNIVAEEVRKILTGS